MKHVIIMPDLGQTSSEAKIVFWLKKLGEKLAMGEPLLEVETDKATMDVEAYVGGYLRKKLANEGDMVAASNPVAILTDTLDEAFDEDVKPKSRSVAPVGTTERAQSTTSVSVSGNVAAVPAARMLAKQLGIDLSTVRGTGPQGLITKADVERSIAESSKATATPNHESKAREAMAALTSRSKSTIPHFYVTLDLDMAAAEGWRARWNQSHPELKASVNDCLVRAASAALAESPRLNTRVSDGKVEQQSSADVLVVAGVDSGLLLVPVADPHGGAVESFLQRMKTALSSAKDGKIHAANVTPLLAISNLGMFGVREFSAIIPPGCNAILAAGALRDQVVWRDGRAEPVRVCTATVSADHRAVDGIAVAQFLERMQFHLNSL
ncbi:MAG TPA: dihydrolipoamide acetyltransferase family protein [Terriglobia bacterium]|nr:dihydrolipoamide acetyltransferase family protein [Terriglobia bacterium]